MTDETNRTKKTLLFNTTKHEAYHPLSEFTKLSRRLRSSGFKVEVNKQVNLSEDVLLDGGCDAIIFGSPREKFTVDEIQSMKNYLEEQGGSLAFFVTDGGEDILGSNMNTFLEEYGIRVERDCVVGAAYCHKYFHPKHVFIANDGNNFHQEIVEHKLQSSPVPYGNKTSYRAASAQDEIHKFSIVYPNGCSIESTQHGSSSIAIISSGALSLPSNRPLAVVYEHSKTNNSKLKRKGRILVVGSSEMFGDAWIDKEDNIILCDILFKFLTHEDNINFDVSKKLMDIEERKCVPLIESLSERIKPCLQEEGYQIPRDINTMFVSKNRGEQQQLFEFNMKLVPQAVKMYETLKINHELLTLIQPEFECPLPPLEPAIFIPRFRDSLPPSLDQFDLDEHFAAKDVRLAYLTNKCSSDEDLEYYVKEAAYIVGVDKDLLESNSTDVKQILNFIFKKVVAFKMIQKNFEPK